MNHDLDPRVCVAIARGAGESVQLVLVDGKIELRLRATLDELVRRERLVVVPRSDLRAMAARFSATAHFEALSRPVLGHDDAETKAFKQVARLQERFRNHGDGWAWWARFLACNSAGTCVDAMRILSSLADEKSSLRAGNAMPVDWLNLLREAIASSQTSDMNSLKVKLRELLDELQSD